MYAAHFAAGMAIGSHAPRAPTWALLVGVFVPDFLWVVFAVAGLEPATPFFDDWSHSLVMIVVWASLYALLFRRRGCALPAGLAVLSHFFLDAPIHPRDVALYPTSQIHLGWGLWRIGFVAYWEVQLAVLGVLAALYVVGERRRGTAPRWILLCCAELLGLHLMNLPA